MHRMRHGGLAFQHVILVAVLIIQKQ